MSEFEETSSISVPGFDEIDKHPQSAPFPVVGVGASAGGLEAFTELLNALPVSTGMAFVLVQHLDPAHESQLTQILSRATSMPVQQVIDGMRIEANSVYVIPPNTSLTIARRALHLAPRASDHSVPLPVDRFFESLAEEQGRLSVGVILSGNGNDGSRGLRAIKSQCGITFVQSENGARFGGMPHSAMASGAADFVLSPTEIAQELTRISTHPSVLAWPDDNTREASPDGEFELQKIFSLVRSSTGVDFSHYKQTTTRRRIGRRMIVQRLQSLAEYLGYLETHPEEIQELYRDSLISVTHFFRDSDAFWALVVYLRDRLRSKEPEDPFRVWVPGCATGEEVYSLAICLQELFTQEDVRPPLQLFGTDINELALGKARAGRYPESIAEDISPERLQQFFHKVDGHYQISKSIRDCCIFAKQDLTHDPPFSRVDLVSCRNMLIYLDQALQKTVMPILHYSLNDAGLLFLGSAETIGAAPDLFEMLDRKHKIYIRKAATVRVAILPSLPRGPLAPSQTRDGRIAASLDWQKQVDQLIQNRYAPDGVIVNQDLSILQVRGRTGYYLQFARPGAGQNLLLLAHEDLQFSIREAVLAAMAQNVPVHRKGLRLEYQGEERQIDLEVIPLSPAAAKERYYFVIFERTDAPQQVPSNETLVRSSQPQTPEQENTRLKQQLGEFAEHLRALTAEHETALEEQKASNEEISSANEELQSSNEELSTAKEELQSANEELTTVNEELQSRNQELSTLVNDLNNLFAAANTPILIFDRALFLRRFTPAAERYLGLSPVDLGRPIADLPIRTRVPQLEQLVRGVINTLSVSTHEMQDHDGSWWSLAIRPYLTLDHRIDGAVLTFADVNLLRRSLQIAEVSRDYAEGIVETVRESLIVLSADCRVESANKAFYHTFQMTREDTEGRLIYDLDNQQWNISPLRHLLEDIVDQNTLFENFAVEHNFPRIGLRSMSLSARRVIHADGRPTRILLAIEDVTERKLAEKKLMGFYSDLEQFGYAVAHDLQEPLRTLSNYSQQFANHTRGELDSESDQILQSLLDGVARMQSMVQDLLAYSQAASTGSNLMMEWISVETALKEALWNLQAAVQESGASIKHDDLSMIHTPRQLTMVLQNLIGNSIKYRGDASPQIHISAVRRTQDWIFSVRDNGIGFDQQYAQAIFGIFKRLEGRKYAGTGIGLAICQRLIERFGGSIWAESERGVGSTFHFTIPVSAVDAPTWNQAHA
jgi:two-component system CheB/CheR fusion protein